MGMNRLVLSFSDWRAPHEILPTVSKHRFAITLWYTYAVDVQLTDEIKCEGEIGSATADTTANFQKLAADESAQARREKEALFKLLNDNCDFSGIKSGGCGNNIDGPFEDELNLTFPEKKQNTNSSQRTPVHDIIVAER